MSADRETGNQRTLLDYGAILRRRKWVALLPLILVPLIAYAYSMQQEKRYTASSEVLLSRQDVSSTLAGVTNSDIFTDPTRFAETQAALARVPEVARRTLVAAHVRALTPGQLLRDSSVTPHSNADILSFTVKAGDPDLAVRLATAYAHAFSAYRLELSTANLANARADLERSLDALRKQNATGTPLYNSLTQKAQELKTMELLQTKPTVVTNADSASQVAPAPRRSALLGAAFGLILGLGAAFLWEALDRRVRDEEEVASILGLPLLARLLAPRQAKGLDRLAMLDEPTEVEAESVRRLRVNFEFANLDLRAKVLMVTSASAGEGKSLTISNLAVALARSGRRVALVDLDLRRPSLSRLFGVSGDVGLTDLALEHVDLDSVLVPVRFKMPGARVPTGGRYGPPYLETVEGPGELYVLPAGSMPSSPGEFVGSTAVTRMFAALRERMDFVLVDTPPLLAVSDGATISTRADALLVVVRLGRVNRPTLRELDRQLDALHAPKLGFVLTGTDPTDFYGTYGYIARDGSSSNGRAASAQPQLAEVETSLEERRRRSRWA